MSQRARHERSHHGNDRAHAPHDAALANARASIAELNKTLPAYKRLMSVRLTAEPFATNATGKKIR